LISQAEQPQILFCDLRRPGSLGPSAPASILKETFGYDTFRPLQSEVIENVLARRDTLAIMPTGGGKSLCYQIPALLLEGLTVVVSPLISLMKDQVEQLRAATASLPCSSTVRSAPQEYQENMEYVKRGEVKLLYVAPETLLTPRILSLLSGLKVALLTIDEAHCISEWGHDFRPEYRQLVEVRKRFPEAVCLALTATATERVRAGYPLHAQVFHHQRVRCQFQPRKPVHRSRSPQHDPIGQTIQILEKLQRPIRHHLLFLAPAGG
jgi:ATP-dependent DNA helicase RecQ